MATEYCYYKLLLASSQSQGLWHCSFGFGSASEQLLLCIFIHASVYVACVCAYIYIYIHAMACLRLLARGLGKGNSFFSLLFCFYCPSKYPSSHMVYTHSSPSHLLVFGLDNIISSKHWGQKFSIGQVKLAKAKAWKLSCSGSVVSPFYRTQFEVWLRFSVSLVQSKQEKENKIRMK